MAAVRPETIIATRDKYAADVAAGKPQKPILAVKIPKVIKEFQGTVFLGVETTAFAKDLDQKFKFIRVGNGKNPVHYPILFGGSQPGSGGPVSDKRGSIRFDMKNLGAFGQAIEIIDNEFHVLAKKILDTPNLQNYITCRDIIGPVVRNYTMKARDATKRGKPLDSPNVSLKFGYGSYAANFFDPVLAGKKKSTCYDWALRKTVADPDGADKAKCEMKDSAGQAACQANYHNIMQSGSIVRSMTVVLDGISLSGNGVSLRATVFEIWIERPPTTVTCVDDDYVESVVAATPVDTPGASTSAAAGTEQEDEVEDEILS